MILKNAHKIHCLGVGGIGVSALAQFFAAQGKEVTGYDDGIPNSQFPIPNDVDLVIYSDAVPEDHPQRVAAREYGIKEMSYAQALGEISKKYKTIVVAGTHGKSTTTAMLGLILEIAGFDPLVIVGTKVPNWPSGNLRMPRSTIHDPRSTIFVVEGDDYRDHFLELNPYAVVVTNIEYDHPDYFRDLEHTIESFKKLVEKISEQGIVVLNRDDRGCRKLYANLINSPIRANWRIGMYGQGDEIAENFSLQVPGEFNKYNVLAAATCAHELGINDEIIKKTISEFKGVWRRFEIVGEFNDAIIISDYGHHPTAIRATMKAAREKYLDRRLVLVYQPHQHSRTKVLFNDFVEALKDVADVVIISEIYAVKGRLEDRDVSSRQLVDGILRLSDHKIANVLYGGDLKKTEKLTRDTIKPGDVVVVMGAGDIDIVARKLCKS